MLVSWTVVQSIIAVYGGYLYVMFHAKKSMYIYILAQGSMYALLRIRM